MQKKKNKEKKNAINLSVKQHKSFGCIIESQISRFSFVRRLLSLCCCPELLLLIVVVVVVIVIVIINLNTIQQQLIDIEKKKTEEIDRSKL